MSLTLKLSPQSTNELEHRRQQALVAAEKCIQLLKNDFGATEVILCGSLAGESPWHWHSDIDLAVRGMTKDAVWDAYSAIEDIVPHWLKVDLIPLESAPRYLVDRILKKIPMPDNRYLALELRIEDELLLLPQNHFSAVEYIFLQQLELVVVYVLARLWILMITWKCNS